MNQSNKMWGIYRKFLLGMVLAIAVMMFYLALFPPRHVIFREATREEKAFSCDNPVAVKSGQVRGAADGEGASCAWKGIPFAAPPVGEIGRAHV